MVKNKNDSYIALPLKIELCLANQLDTRWYTPEQNRKFKDASIHFEHFYNRRRAAFRPLSNAMIEKKFRHIFSNKIAKNKRTKQLYREGLGVPGTEKSDKERLRTAEQSRAIVAATKKRVLEYLTQRSSATKIEYDEVITKIWAKTKTTHSYAATLKVFTELKNAGFEAETMLDFGCGIGPGLWAANEVWNDTLRHS